MPSEYDAAVNEEQARQRLREASAAGRATRADAEAVKDAQRKLDAAKAAAKKADPPKGGKKK